ncbi:MAG: hypothetical protein ABGX07_17940, partial [Pirellulaceae bacterium]
MLATLERQRDNTALGIQFTLIVRSNWVKRHGVFDGGGQKKNENRNPKRQRGTRLRFFGRTSSQLAAIRTVSRSCFSVSKIIFAE